MLGPSGSPHARANGQLLRHRTPEIRAGLTRARSDPMSLGSAARSARCAHAWNICYFSGSTGVHPRTETARSATEALELVRTHMRLRHPGLIIETADGEELSFFQLKDLAQSETREQNGLRTKPRAPNITHP
jgi:hypothetical protein